MSLPNSEDHLDKKMEEKLYIKLLIFFLIPISLLLIHGLVHQEMKKSTNLYS